MSKSRKVIAYKNLPGKISPISIFCTVTCLHYWDAPQWVWAVIMIPLSLKFFMNIIDMIKEDNVDLFNEEGPETCQCGNTHPLVAQFGKCGKCMELDLPQ